MRWIDMHCDTLCWIVEGMHGSLRQNQGCVDIERLERFGASQFFACFVNRSSYQGWDQAYEAVLRMISCAKEREPAFFEERDWTVEDTLPGGILTVEEGGILNGDLGRLEELRNKGVRLMTLTWNHENCIGSPNSRDRRIMEKGLTPFGREVIAEMNRLGMIIDVSHLSDGGFYDCIRYSRSPVVASHSNARALCSHPRNLTDEMLRLLGEKGGVAGVNFYSAFLSDDGNADVTDIARHAAWIVRVAGEDAAALGSDFDGFDLQSMPGGIHGVQDMERVLDAMKKQGLTERQIDKIAWNNVLRVLKTV